MGIHQWALIIGAVVPVLVGIITKANADAGLKATLLLSLELLNGIAVEFFATPAGFEWGNALLNALAAFITGVAAYYGFLKHTVNKVVVYATARFGVGGSSPYRNEYRRDAA